MRMERILIIDSFHNQPNSPRNKIKNLKKLIFVILVYYHLIPDHVFMTGSGKRIDLQYLVKSQFKIVVLSEAEVSRPNLNWSELSKI